LSAKTTSCLNETAPAIVQACEAQVRYMWKHTTDFENSGTNKDGTTLRRSLDTVSPWPLQPEVHALLQPYRRIIMAG
jgi:hypothetical protein